MILIYINEIDLKESSSGEISPAIIKLAKKEVLVPITNCINKCISIKYFRVGRVGSSRCHNSVISNQFITDNFKNI